MEIVVSRVPYGSPEYQEVFDLREEILRKPIGLSLHNEDLSRDKTDTILAGKHDGRVVACLILTDKGDGIVQLRQMAVYNECQGKGVGKALVLAAEKIATENGYTKMILHARKHAMGFYRSLGYTQHGDEFSEVGIPHYHMEKELL
ncbi:MAG: GNAT family N-acetyltransferase [Taibaiella sp.]|nr:GNAT family N-acetyltransferase [Taibaiella sp.]